ncbi:thiamine phosphate synthase [Neisseria chenwenguii]|uniref:Thiamine-phosphate synthase n=1 Tax=Neisseria chenwenguii TaxID=1853278 RepID=A0A220S0A6_9NEIS|nr:thiamine phosphate synthase [Neisseria chenwenguii]ASK26796.1 thiamine phosphate synthase [Neisseria chenwenguii]ROV56773.1 thiamine phosphate synthase [Neisseria chenwenguii]
MNPQKMREILNLYFVAGTQDCRHLGALPEENLLGVLEQALRAGISCYQFREKGEGSLTDEARMRALAAACRDLCRRYGVAFVVNNDVYLALELGADGVHIGQSDMPAAEAAALCQGRLFLGLSHSNMAEIEKSLPLSDGIDYFAAGPIFSTVSKDDASPQTGLDFIRAIRQAGVDKPLAAIGGIGVNEAAAVRTVGVDGVAVVSAITRAADIAAAVAALRG